MATILLFLTYRFSINCVSDSLSFSNLWTTQNLVFVKKRIKNVMLRFYNNAEKIMFKIILAWYSINLFVFADFIFVRDNFTDRRKKPLVRSKITNEKVSYVFSLTYIVNELIFAVKKEFRVILVNGCRHVIKAINPENLIHSLHIKAFRGKLSTNLFIYYIHLVSYFCVDYRRKI